MLGQDGNSLASLLIINAVIFVLLNFVKIIYLLSGDVETSFVTQVLNYVTLPGNPVQFVSRPWTLISYMFSHYSIWMLVSNLLWLWCYGYILQDLNGNKKVIPIYLYGGFIGGLLFLITAAALPNLQQTGVQNLGPMVGAGPALMALSVATTTISPTYKIFPLIRGGIPLWVLTTIFILIHFATNGMLHPAFAAAEIAGGLIGFVIIWQMQKGNDWCEWMINFYNWVNQLFNPQKKSRIDIKKQKLHYKATQQPYQRTPHITQQRVDDLLDKINQKGYNSLSEEEKEFLKKASKEEF